MSQSSCFKTFAFQRKGLAKSIFAGRGLGLQHSFQFRATAVSEPTQCSRKIDEMCGNSTPTPPPSHSLHNKAHNVKFTPPTMRARPEPRLAGTWPSRRMLAISFDDLTPQLLPPPPPTPNQASLKCQRVDPCRAGGWAERG